MLKKGLYPFLVIVVMASMVLAACATPTPEVIEKVVTQVVKETVKETVIVEGTPQVLEKEVTRIVEVEKEVTAAPSKDLLDEVLEAGVLVVSTDPNYAPQSFLNEAGELDGFDVNVAQEVAKRMGVELQFELPDWDIITAGNWAGRWDVSIGSMTPTVPRSEVLWFTAPYYFTPASFAVHRDNTTITSPEDLTGKKLGLGAATTYVDFLNDALVMIGGQVMYDPPPGIEMVEYTTDSEAIQDLALGDGVRLDAVMSAQPTIQSAIEEGLPLKYVGSPAFYEPLVFSLDKSRGPSDKMLAKLNEILAGLHLDGTLTKLSLKWYGVDITKIEWPEVE